MVIKKILFVYFLFLSILIIAQVNNDSLKIIWNNPNQPDSNRFRAIRSIAWYGYLYSDPDSAYYFAQQHYDFAKSKGLKKQMGIALNTQGVSFWIQGDYSSAIACYNRCITIGEEIGNKQGVSSSLSNIGMIYSDQGNFIKAIDYYIRCLTIKEEIGDKKGIANTLINIGNIYHQQDDLVSSTDYYTRGLAICEEIGYKNGIASNLNNLGNIYKNQGNYSSAIDYYTRSITIEQELNNKQGISRCLSNIGSLYYIEGDYSTAIDYFNRSLAICEEIGYKEGIASSLNKIGAVFMKKGNYTNAIRNNILSLSIARDIGAIIETESAANALYEAYKVIGKNKLSLEMYELYIATRDSILNEENRKEVIRQEYKYAYEKQAAADRIKSEEAKRQASVQLARQKNFRNISIVSSFFIFIVAVLIYIGYRRKRKSNRLLTKKNEQIQFYSNQLSEMNVNLEENIQDRTEELRNTNLQLQKEIEDRKKINDKLVKSKEKAEESDRLKTAFLCNMSHEIRTPMNGVIGFASLLKEPEFSGEEKLQFINLIEKSGARMLSTLHDIIDISKIESGPVPISISKINLNEQMDELFEFFLPQTQKKNIQFSITNRLPNQHTTVKSDKEKLYSIMSNLIKNAIKFTHAGTIEFGCFLNNKNSHQQLDFYIKDTGIGIPKKRRKAIFDRFVKADIEDKQAFEGSGLGLAISKAYIELLGGEIWVESKEEIGSQFYFTVPYLPIDTNSR